MEHLIVVNNPADWNLDIPGVKVVAARKYLSDPSFSDLDKVKVYNLCRSYRYQSTGYYVSLLASARGAIARFDRNAIEIRVLDLQEHPGVDIAILQFITGVIKSLTESKWQNIEILKQLDTIQLSSILTDTTKFGGKTILAWPDYLKAFGVNAIPMEANQLWLILFNQLEADVWAEGDPSRDIIKIILNEGNLSERIIRKLGKNPRKDDLFNVYDRLRGCLHEGTMFT